MMTMMRVIAAAYNRAPLVEPRAVPSWRELAAHSVAMATELRLKYHVVEVADELPYPDADAMFRDIERGQFRVSTTNCVHPVWTVAENVAFRIVHDIMGHYRGRKDGNLADFTWEGECDAYLAHEQILGHGLVRDALFTEILGQGAVNVLGGAFGEQKVAFLW